MKASDIFKSLIKEKNWKEIIDIGTKLPLEDKKSILWIWPTEKCLIFLKNTLKEDFCLNLILSIGCGTGLFEWIVKESTGINVIGVERDESWWKCKYSPNTYIQLHFIDDSVQMSDQVLREFVPTTTQHFALLFCYFNNMQAFHKYLQAYQQFGGKCLIIIGPGNHKNHKNNIFTEPSPFNLGLESNSEWNLFKYCEIGNTNNFIAIYSKK